MTFNPIFDGPHPDSAADEPSSREKLDRAAIVTERTECDDASACLSVTHSGDWTRPDTENIKSRAVRDLQKHANLKAVWPVDRPVAKTGDNLLA